MIIILYYNILYIIFNHNIWVTVDEEREEIRKGK